LPAFFFIASRQRAVPDSELTEFQGRMHLFISSLLCVLTAVTSQFNDRQAEGTCFSKSHHANYGSDETSLDQEREDFEEAEATSKCSLLQVKDRLHRRHDGVQESSEVSVVPAPSTVVRTAGSLMLGKAPLLAIEAASEKSRRAFEEHVLTAMEGASSVEAGNEGNATLVQLRLAESSNFAEEGYSLQVTQDKVVLEAGTEHGLFNGLMTLHQLLQSDSGKWSLPLVKIEDAPAFEWRGLMLDVSRHFFPAKDVKRLLKTMALFKLNHFHWHLTDDQGWRFPVEKYPKLISLGSHRRATQKGHEASSGEDDTPYDGSYTEVEIEDIMKLAATLHIEVVPEFDLPGHSEAAIAAYPEMGNSDSDNPWAPEVSTKFGAMPYTLSPSKKAENFTSAILAEMTHLFNSSSYIHIGGDEVSRDQWTRSKVAKEVAEEEGVSVNGIEGKMLEHAAGHLQGLKRHAIVWDEAMSSGADLPSGTVVMLWRSWEGLSTLGNRAKARNFPVVLAPQSNTYLDQWQSDGGRGEKYDAIGGYLPLSKVYDTPLSAGGARVLGLQGQLWSEYIAGGGPDLDYMAWPRGCALAEAGWSGSKKPGYLDFKERLKHHLADFKRLGVNYHSVDTSV